MLPTTGCGSSAPKMQRSMGYLLRLRWKTADAIRMTEMEYLLAAQAAHEQAMKNSSRKRKVTGGNQEEEEEDENELDVVDCKSINIHMKKIYEKNLTNAKYNCHLPAYIDSANPHQYILIPATACQEWVCAFPALFSHTEGS